MSTPETPLERLLEANGRRSAFGDMKRPTRSPVGHTKGLQFTHEFQAKAKAQKRAAKKRADAARRRNRS